MKAKYDFSQGRRSAIDPMPSGNTRNTIRIDDDLLYWLCGEVHAAGGGNYQTMINHALREYVQRRNQPLGKILHCIVREELTASQGVNEDNMAVAG